MSLIKLSLGNFKIAPVSSINRKVPYIYHYSDRIKFLLIEAEIKCNKYRNIPLGKGPCCGPLDSRELRLDLIERKALYGTYLSQ
jgi:hypothetical protein